MIKSILLIFLLTFSSHIFASFACNNRAVAREGDSSADVKIKCGSPMSIENVGQIENDNGELVNLERWTYNPGYGKFYQILEFQNGVLISIKSGQRVE